MSSGTCTENLNPMAPPSLENIRHKENRVPPLISLPMYLHVRNVIRRTVIVPVFSHMKCCSFLSDISCASENVQVESAQLGMTVGSHFQKDGLGSVDHLQRLTMK